MKRIFLITSMGLAVINLRGQRPILRIDAERANREAEERRAQTVGFDPRLGDSKDSCAEKCAVCCGACIAAVFWRGGIGLLDRWQQSKKV